MSDVGVLSVERGDITHQIRKRLVRSLMDILILDELKKRSLSGYDITLLIHKSFNFPVSPGSVYSVLYSLEREGLIRGFLRGKKRVYMLTSKGEMAVDAVLNMNRRILYLISRILPEENPEGLSAEASDREA
ncbi:MAG: PadR-like family transcriptional regulator [Candidatus Bathyarchaeota archaeon B26-2]|nr:MAG: PadR-like family transcriptional regulator [Candidatus Bathyarchaeota archaeon B26-2]